MILEMNKFTTSVKINTKVTFVIVGSVVDIFSLRSVDVFHRNIANSNGYRQVGAFF